MGPIQYLQAMPQEDFLRDIQGGFQLGSALQDSSIKRQQLQLALDLKKQYLTDAQAAMQNPNPQAFAALAVKYPEHAAHLKDSWGMLNTEQQQNELRDASTLAAALHANRPDVALDAVNQRIELMQKQGQPTQQLELLRDTIQNDPTKAYGSVMHVISGIPGGDKVLGNLATVGKEARDQELQAPMVAGKKAETVNVLSQVDERSKRLALDRDRLDTETQTKLLELKQKFGELPEYVTKDVNAAATDSVSSQQSAGRMFDLAGQIDKVAPQMGTTWKGTIDEWWKRNMPGASPNELTRIRAEYNRIVTPAAMAAYKRVASGSTSDKDIDTAMVGVPKSTDSPEQMASFLRGAAKLQVYDSVMSNAKAEWMASVRHLGKTPADVEIDGVKVPAGTTFKQFVDGGYLDRKISTQLQAINSGAPAAGGVQSRSYMRHAGGQ